MGGDVEEASWVAERATDTTPEASKAGEAEVLKARGAGRGEGWPTIGEGQVVDDAQDAIGDCGGEA